MTHNQTVTWNISNCNAIEAYLLSIFLGSTLDKKCEGACTCFTVSNVATYEKFNEKSGPIKCNPSVK